MMRWINSRQKRNIWPFSLEIFPFYTKKSTRNQNSSYKNNEKIIYAENLIIG